MIELIQLPFTLIGLIWNTAIPIVVSLVNITVGVVVGLLQALAPFATLGLFFVSNESESKAILTAEKQPKTERHSHISTPEDGEWFSELFETEMEVEKVKLGKKQVVIYFPKINRQKDETRFVNINVYSFKSKPNNQLSQLNKI